MKFTTNYNKNNNKLTGFIGFISRDRRVDLDVRDSSGRRLEEVVGVALGEMKEEDKVEILQIIENYRQWRIEEEGRRNSLEEENIDIDGLHRLKVFDKIKELVGELQELHASEKVKLMESQEVESHQFMEKLERDVVSFHDKQQEEWTVYLSKITQEKFDFDQRQQSELLRLLKKQADETHSLQRPMSRQSELTSPRSFSQSRPSSRRPSLKTHIEIPNSETLSDSSGPSLWEWTVPDEGYSTGKDHELPEMIDCARKELECPICMEIMAPPSRIWQCKVRYVTREMQKLLTHILHTNLTTQLFLSQIYAKSVCQSVKEKFQTSSLSLTQYFRCCFNSDVFRLDM